MTARLGNMDFDCEDQHRRTPAEGRFSTSYHFRSFLRPICEDSGAETDGKLPVAINQRPWVAREAIHLTLAWKHSRQQAGQQGPLIGRQRLKHLVLHRPEDGVEFAQPG